MRKSLPFSKYLLNVINENIGTTCTNFSLVLLLLTLNSYLLIDSSNKKTPKQHPTQLAFTCSESLMKASEKGVKSVPS